MKDLIIKVHHKIGDAIAREYACDSAYILVEMRRLGVDMCLKFYWVHSNVILYIVIDNT